MDAILQIIVTLLGVTTVYFVSASVVLPYFVQRKLSNDRTLEKIEARATEKATEAIETYMANNQPKLIAGIKSELRANSDEILATVGESLVGKMPEFIKKFTEDELICESLQALGDSYVEHLEHVIYGKMGVDAKQVKQAKEAVQNFVTDDGQNPIGGIIQQIATKAGKGEDLDFKSLLLQLALPYIQAYMQKQQGGFGGSPSFMRP